MKFKKIIRKIGLFFGIYSLEEECRRAYGSKLARMHNDINSGIPIGGYYETILVVNKIVKINENAQNKSIFAKIKRKIAEK